MIRVIGLLLAPLALLGAAEYEVWIHQTHPLWHVLDGLLAITLIVCAVGIVAAQPEKEGRKQ